MSQQMTRGLFQYSWGGGSDDERFTFYCASSYEKVVAALRQCYEDGYDMHDYSEVESAMELRGVVIRRHFNEEPTFIHEEEVLQS